MPRRLRLAIPALLLLVAVLSGCSSVKRSLALLTPTPPPTATADLPPDRADPATGPGGRGPVVFAGQTLLGSASPWLLAAGPGGSLYIADDATSQIIELDAGGQIVTRWGSRGTSDGQFLFQERGIPLGGLAVDPRGNVNVIDSTGRLQIFDPNGHLLSVWPPHDRDTDPGRIMAPSGLAIDGKGVISIADRVMNRIVRFNRDGQFLSAFGRSGSGQGELLRPAAIAISDAGVIYVWDSGNRRIEGFDANGNFVAEFGQITGSQDAYARPVGLAVDELSNVYITDVTQNRIRKFDDNNLLVGIWGSEGFGAGRFDRPAGITIDRSGSILVADRGNHRIERFRRR